MERLSLLAGLGSANVRSAGELERLHAALSFICAFPGTREEYRLAREGLADISARVARLPKRQRRQLADSGIAGSDLCYAFSYESAQWLQRHAGNSVVIDWSDGSDPQGLYELLALLLHDAEDEYFDSGYISGREWLQLASTNSGLSDFSWLIEQTRRRYDSRLWAQLYDAAELWLQWSLGDSKYSKTANVLPVRKVVTRGAAGMRRPPANVTAEIRRPLRSVRRVSVKKGRNLVNIAIASLATRHRETFHFNHANPGEVYVADIGRGVSVVVYGLKSACRYPLESTMGYLIVSNGQPIGYGGSSVLFRQVNTGLNIFAEYRHSEASFLWVQVMRVYRQLTGCKRFIVNAYQFGAGNDEALGSGAFWLYYRLGFRPVEANARALARREYTRIRGDRQRRSSLSTLRRLAESDMHLVLPGSRPSELFDEDWLETSSMLASRVLAGAGGRTRNEAVERVVKQLATDLGLRNLGDWTRDERQALGKIAPFVGAAKPSRWSAAEKRAMRAVLRAKGGPCEADFARRLAKHDRFLSDLRLECRRAASQ